MSCTVPLPFPRGPTLRETSQRRDRYEAGSPYSWSAQNALLKVRIRALYACRGVFRSTENKLVSHDRFFRAKDRARLAPISSCVFEAKTVVRLASADLEDSNTWITISAGDDEILQCRAPDVVKTNLWKDALTAAMVLAVLLESMKGITNTATAAAGGAIILKSVYMLKVSECI